LQRLKPKANLKFRRIFVKPHQKVVKKNLQFVAGGLLMATTLSPLPALAQNAPPQPAGAPTNPLGTSGGIAPNAGSVPTPLETAPRAGSTPDVETGDKDKIALPMITAAPGSPEEVAQLRALVNALSTRLQTLEDAQKKTAAAVSKPNVSSGSKLPITISGLVQVHGLANFNQDGPDARASDTIRLRRGELRVTGQITRRLKASMALDIAKTQNSSDRPSDSVLQEIILSYLLQENQKRGTSNTIDIGQFKIPVGYEGDLVSASATQTIERALMFQNRDPFRGGYGDKRETGVQLRGERGQFAYWIGAFNGLGERQNELSASDNKAVLARLVYQPNGKEGLRLGISGGVGNTGNPTAGQPRLDRNLLNLFAVYKKNKITAQTEYLAADAQTIADTFVRDVRSYYGSLGYLFTKKLEGVARYDVFDFSRDGSGGKISEATLGMNYYIQGNNAKIQANIVQRDGDDNAPSGFRNDGVQLRTSFQAAF
jgi:phosphate-selective porin